MSAPTWTSTPTARAILARLTPDDLQVRIQRPIVGPDTLVLAGEITEDLERVRRRWIDRAFGAEFHVANAAGRGAEYLAFDAQHPSVEQVLAERFGDPAQYRGWDRETADLHWRADAWAALRDGRAAA